MGKEKKEEKRDEVRREKGEERRGPPPDFRALERELAELHRLLGEHTFESEEEIKEFLDRTLAEAGGKIPRTAPRTPLEEAQNLVYEAWETEGPERVALARKALEICPDCADAYVILAEETACSTAEARDLYAKGVAAAERALGPEIFKEEAGHFWGLLSTRPYMRARLGLAQCLWELGEYEAAVEHFRDLLRLNPRDNQGVRFFLINALLILGRDQDAKKLLARYRDDPTAWWAYSRALLAFRQQGDTPHARKLLRRALAANPHVPKYLLGWEPLPPDTYDSVGFGDESEAVDYVTESRSVWYHVPGALDWLAEIAGD
ncbi:tetratricopeptide repeat protein [Candidatus Bipolaricaulota bacterium]|nr:tetratricopeptide repeat protein [Candidatus Bipolaricaulota bacterium]